MGASLSRHAALTRVTTGSSTLGARVHAPWLLAGAALLVIALAFALVTVATPSDGARVPPGTVGFEPPGVRVAPIAAGTSALHAGDLVTAVGGRSLASVTDALFDPGAQRPRLAVGDVVAYEVVRDGAGVTVDVPLQRYPLAAAARANWGTIVFALVYLLVAAFVYARRPGVPASRPFLLSACALVAATTWSLGLDLGHILGAAGFWLYQAGAGIAFMLFWSAGLCFALRFPSPSRLGAARWSAPVILGAPAAVFTLYLAAQWVATSDTLAWIATWHRVVDLHAALALALTVGVFIAQGRSQSTPPGRQQVRWVILAAVAVGGIGLALYLLPPLFGRSAISPNVVGVIATAFPIAVAIAIVRHNLFDIDRLLSHALVYGGLTAAVVALYVGLVTGVGSVLRAGSDPWLALLATAVVAIGFQPLRARWQRLVDRRLFGERDEPVRLLTRLGERLEASIAPDRVLPTLTQAVAEALRLPYVAITLEEADAHRVAADYGRPQPIAAQLPLIVEGESVGRLQVAARDADGSLDTSDLDVLATIARQAANAVQALRLTRELQHSRQQLVTLREEERRRLRRDLHDGLGPSLAALALKLEAASNVVGRSPNEAQALLAEATGQVHASVAEIRRVAHGLRPPALDDLGLVEALRELARQLEHGGLRVEVDAPGSMPALPAAVEVAAYRIAQEALTNVVRHAAARRCQVTLRSLGALELEIRDDGRGLAATSRSHGRRGVGLRAMAERAGELGGTLSVDAPAAGGTRVQARIPYAEDAS
jgi:signal transduction histidine kinase